jgi:hypothetical protein
MRPGFLAGTDYWFGQVDDEKTETYRPEEYDIYDDETKLDWFKQFWVDKPLWKKYT